jgi:hypothetical protein
MPNAPRSDSSRSPSIRLSLQSTGPSAMPIGRRGGCRVRPAKRFQWMPSLERACVPVRPSTTDGRRWHGRDGRCRSSRDGSIGNAENEQRPRLRRRPAELPLVPSTSSVRSSGWMSMNPGTAPPVGVITSRAPMRIVRRGKRRPGDPTVSDPPPGRGSPRPTIKALRR